MLIKQKCSCSLEACFGGSSIHHLEMENLSVLVVFFFFSSFHIFRGVWCHGKTVFFKKFKFIFMFLNYFDMLI